MAPASECLVDLELGSFGPVMTLTATNETSRELRSHRGFHEQNVHTAQHTLHCMVLEGLISWEEILKFTFLLRGIEADHHQTSNIC